MTELTIVAIPEERDRVWKVSSEKVPHLTMLFLGDVDSEKIPLISSFLSHAAETSLRRFGMMVDRRGTLGDKEADVFFFDKQGISDLKDFRGFLLQNDHIKTAYDSTEQYPEWTPHLTLGYPETPANEEGDDYISWVSFDRIALWTGEYEGPTFLLKDYDYAEEVSMSNSAAEAVQNILKHYGVKGMKWGIRKPPGAPPGPAEAIGYKAVPGKGVVKTVGGRNQPVSEDAIKAAVSLQKAKASSIASLSNTELKALNERLQLEQRYRQLVPAKKSKIKIGQDFTKEVLAVGATANEVANFAKSPVGVQIRSRMDPKFAAQLAAEAAKKAAK